MKTKSSALFAIAFLGINTTSLHAQVAINNSATPPNASAILDLQTGNTGVNKGFLPQAIALTATNSAAPVASPATGLIVYNTATAGVSPNNVAPGYYYWTGTAWASMNSWALTGNAGTVAGTNFIGTTDANALEFKVDNAIAGYIDYVAANANVSFGYDDLSVNTGSKNSALGYQALYKNTTGIQNTASGYQALTSNTTGSFNTANGGIALFRNSTGYHNTANGYGALFFNTSGSANTASGYVALTNNNADFNTAMGDSALYANTSGTDNTAIGYEGLTSNTTGTDNTASGYEALSANTTGSYNTGNGYAALAFSTTGNNNTATGFGSLAVNLTASSNTATGAYSLFNNSADQNTAIGDSALFANSTGTDNTASGYKALAANGGTANTATGANSLYKCTSGGNNEADGFEALFNNTSGGNNSGIGFEALFNNTTGSNNTAIGSTAGPSTGGLSNTTAIGNGATVTTSNTIVLGNASITSLQCNVQTITALSDGRFKKDIKTDVHGLDFIMKLTPVSYHLNITKLNAFKKVKDADRQSVLAAEAVMQNGFIAQDVEKAAKAINYDFPGLKTPQNDSDTYGLGYTDFVMPLVKAVQEQEDTILALRVQLEALKNANAQKMSQITSQMQNDEKDIAELKSLLINTNPVKETASINK